ncbi:Hypothetical protein NTJ_06297 [Nesidiocoris tenuis]|uniref:Lon protease homolog n=1 Tax=Nesidiocoris tenuis TaxID=355587 RepID=A0ABN7ASW5_9HEMI|nr:Hypothetical protein NTJ_06297 [Nesidiocoris tenuis]
MSLKDPIPIVFAPFVLLPGAVLRYKVSSTDERSFFMDLVKRQPAESPIHVGLIPSVYGSQKLQPGNVGTYAKLISYAASIEKGSLTLLLKGLQRMIVERASSRKPMAYVRLHDDPKESPELVLSGLKSNGLMPIISMMSQLGIAKRLGDPEFSPDRIAEEFEFTYEEKLEILEALSFSERLTKMISIMEKILQVKDKSVMRMTVIKPPGSSYSSRPIKYWGGFGPGGRDEDPNQDLAKKIEEARMPPDIHKVAINELARLNSMLNINSEASVQRNYLETLVSLPWSISSQDRININSAKEELEKDHYGMEKVKRRILEYLAVKQLTKSQLKGPILCFVGPPGVGKTSVGRSIARILGRKFQRICLGGVSDASDIRGSRKTYVGAMPGRIIQALKYCGTNNPVILLDEVDKMSDGRLHGNPLAALLEVLDPEQNAQFTDHYLGLPFDLSQVIFIATSNTVDTIPVALKDRMEILELGGYTEEEKYHIAKDFIIPKSLIDHGLEAESVMIPEETLRFVVSAYSREAGVRTLERKIAALLRDAALKIAAMTADGSAPLDLLIDIETVKAVLGGQGYRKSDDRQWTEGSVPGVVVGLAYTGIGGDILPIEATKITPGSGKLILTGKLGKVLTESAKIAFDWLKMALPKYQMAHDLRRIDVHIHLPSGAVSKDGPSAGIALATSLVSLFSGTPVLPDLALTGELTLQGLVLPVGGLKEKLTAAHRAGINKVIVPKKCELHFLDVPQHLIDALEIIPVDHMAEVIDFAFNGAINEIASLVSKL